MSQEKGNGVLTEVTLPISGEDLEFHFVESRRKRRSRFE
jgi:hypothetical protein